MESKLFNVRQAARQLGNTQKYVRDLLYEGKLPGAKKVGNRWVIPGDAIRARIKARELASRRAELVA